MRTRYLWISLVTGSLLAAILTCLRSDAAEEERPDWWKAERDAVTMPMDGKTEFAALAAQLADSKPKTAQEAMFKVSVLMRGGLNDEAMQALKDLKALSPTLDSSQISSIYRAAREAHGDWDLARAVVEIFAADLSQLNLGGLLEHLLASGWSVGKVDQWMAAMPKGTNSFWVKERLRFKKTHGRAEPFVQALSDSVRNSPEDIQGALTFLEALQYAGYEGQHKLDLAWLTQTLKPKRATEAEGIASRLRGLTNWAEAVPFYQQAIQIPLTEEEVHQLGRMCQVRVPDEKLRAMFAAKVREETADCLLKLGRNDEAQKWMVEAADIREKNGLGRNALFAGIVQAASGERVIEGRIREEEKKSEDNPEYWRERAQYYRGRNEPEQEEEALKKGLALTAPQLEREFKGNDWRSSLLKDYAFFLARVNRTGEAVALLRKELEQAPAAAQSAERAAYLLATDFAAQVRADDDVLWSWLAKRPKWDHWEERLLKRMLQKAKREDLDKHFSRAEALAKEQDPSRAYTVGWIMNEMDFAARSIPLLQDAVARATDGELKDRAASTLFESYLGMGDWSRAEQIFPEARKRHAPREVSEWYSRIALVAAKAGAKADALRLWKAVLNVNPSEMNDLDDLARLGLTDKLTEVYREMQKKMPSSTIPATALKALEAM